MNGWIEYPKNQPDKPEMTLTWYEVKTKDGFQGEACWWGGSSGHWYCCSYWNDINGFREKEAR